MKFLKIGFKPKINHKSGSLLKNPSQSNDFYVRSMRWKIRMLLFEGSGNGIHSISFLSLV